MSRRKPRSSLRHVDHHDVLCLDSSEDDADSNLSFRSHPSMKERCSKSLSTTKSKKMKQCRSNSRITKRPTKKTLKTDEAKSTDDNSNNDDDDEESELEVPYAHNFDETQIRLHAELDDVRKEPLRPGDVIVYHHPVFVKEIRVAQVIAVNPTLSQEQQQQQIPLELSNGECLEADTNIQRIREYRKGTLYPHAGISRPIQNYVLKSTKRKLPENQRLTKVQLQQLKNRILVAKDDDKNHRHNDDNSSSSSSSFLRQTQQALQQLPPRWIRLSKEFQQNSQIMLMPHESTGTTASVEEETRHQVVRKPSLEQPNISNTLDLSLVVTRRNKKRKQQSSQQKQQQHVSTRSPSDSHSIPQNVQQLDATTDVTEIYDLSSSPCSKKTKSMDHTPEHLDDTLSKSSNPSEGTIHLFPTKSKLVVLPPVHDTGSLNSDDDDDDSQEEKPSAAPAHRSCHPSNENKINPSLHKAPTRKKTDWDDDDENHTTGTVTATTQMRTSAKIDQLKKDLDNNQSSQNSFSISSTRVLTTKKTTKHWKLPFAKDKEAEDSSDDDKLPASVLRSTKRDIPKPPPHNTSPTSRSSKRTVQSFLTTCGNESSPASEEENIKKIQVEEFQSIMSQLSNASTQQGSHKARTGKKILRESMSSTSSSSPFSYAGSVAIRHRPAYQKKPPESSPSSDEDDLSFFRRIRYSVDPSVRNTGTSKQRRAPSIDDRGYSSIDDSVTVTDKNNDTRASNRLDSNADENGTKKKRRAVLMHARRPFTTTTNHTTILSNNYRTSRQLELRPLPRR